MKYHSEMHDIFFHFWKKKTEDKFHKISAQISRIFFDTVEKYDFGLVLLKYRRHRKKNFRLTRIMLSRSDFEFWNVRHWDIQY